MTTCDAIMTEPPEFKSENTVKESDGDAMTVMMKMWMKEEAAERNKQEVAEQTRSFKNTSGVVLVSMSC